MTINNKKVPVMAAVILPAFSHVLFPHFTASLACPKDSSSQTKRRMTAPRNTTYYGNSLALQGQNHLFERYPAARVEKENSHGRQRRAETLHITPLSSASPRLDN